MTVTPNRHPVLNEDQLTDRQREVHDRIVSGPRGVVQGPLRVWLQSPDLADRAQALGQFARFDTRLPPRLSELAIIVTARLWSAGVEWTTHAPIAARDGVDASIIEAIAHGGIPTFEDATQAAVFHAAVELHRDRAISEKTYATALDALGLEALVELVGICGYYTLISMTINAFHVPDGEGQGLPTLDLRPEEMFRA